LPVALLTQEGKSFGFMHNSFKPGFIKIPQGLERLFPQKQDHTSNSGEFSKVIVISS